jgi:hypothetical protein
MRWRRDIYRHGMLGNLSGVVLSQCEALTHSNFKNRS